jgi:hypothetical protein
MPGRLPMPKVPVSCVMNAVSTYLPLDLQVRRRGELDVHDVALRRIGRERGRGAEDEGGDRHRGSQPWHCPTLLRVL